MSAPGPTLPVVLPEPERLELSDVRLLNGLTALSLLKHTADALERAAVLVSDEQARVALYAEASRARKLLAETP